MSGPYRSTPHLHPSRDGKPSLSLWRNRAPHDSLAKQNCAPSAPDDRVTRTTRSPPYGVPCESTTGIRSICGPVRIDTCPPVAGVHRGGRLGEGNRAGRATAGLEVQPSASPTVRRGSAAYPMIVSATTSGETSPASDASDACAATTIRTARVCATMPARVASGSARHASAITARSESVRQGAARVGPWRPRMLSACGDSKRPESTLPIAPTSFAGTPYGISRPARSTAPPPVLCAS